MNIDWSKAPAHATHWCPGNARIEAGWIYQAGSEFYSCYAGSSCEHIPVFPEWRKSRLIPRPSPWSGEGLPPVGTVCEIAPPYRNHGSKVRVLCHDEGDAICRLIEGDELGDIRQYMASEVRPIRTPEQIAAEQKKVAIEQTIKDLKAVNGCGFYSIAEDLYDAGYRKQVQP